MFEDLIMEFTESVFQFIVGKRLISKNLLVKKHTENLKKHGDFSYPNTIKSWHWYISSSHITDQPEASLMQCIGKKSSDLLLQSESWNLKVSKVIEIKDRVHIFLDRAKAIHSGLSSAISNNNLISNNLIYISPFVQSDPQCEGDCLTYLRLKYLSKSIQNLYHVNEQCRSSSLNIFVSSKPTSRPDRAKLVLCGAVLNAKTGAKESTVKADDFIRIRQNEMTLVAQHKYGVRVTTDSKWKEFISHLGESATVFELLQIKPSSAVKVNLECSAGSSKGASFVLYNCARLETILRTYNNKVEDGEYPPLPDFKDIDFSLLVQEEEWTLIFNSIIALPSLLASCVEINAHNCEFRPHLICGFLCSMVRVFSQYYRRIRILTEPRKHLMPVMFARIHMLRTLNETLKICLKILNIKSVSQM